MVLKLRNKSNANIKLTRKQLRKEMRKEKKMKRKAYYTHREVPQNIKKNGDSEDKVLTTLQKCRETNKVLSTEEQYKKEHKEQKKLQKDMEKQRKEQFLKANIKEDQTIKKLEKQLKLHKRKSKAVPKSFVIDGLDYLLEVCDSEYMKNVGSAENDLNEVNNDFEEDFALVTGQRTKTNYECSDEDFQDFLSGDNFSEGDNLGMRNDSKVLPRDKKNKVKKRKTKNDEIDENVKDFLTRDDILNEEMLYRDLGNHIHKISEGKLESEIKIFTSKKKAKKSAQDKKVQMQRSVGIENLASETTSKHEKAPKKETKSKKFDKNQKDVDISTDSLIESENKALEQMKGMKGKNKKNLQKMLIENNDCFEEDNTKNLYLSNEGNSDKVQFFSELKIVSKQGLKNKSVKRKLNKSENEGQVKKRNRMIIRVGEKKDENENNKTGGNIAKNNGNNDEENLDFADGVEENGSNYEDNEHENNGVWEDIYGRLRSKDGSVMNTNEKKYVPPAMRAKMEGSTLENKKRNEKLGRLRKQLKGLLNRLAESNMHSIASQIEGLYMNNSRNDMNESLTTLILESLVSSVSTPERLLMEHVVLIAILHANVGTEIGAHLLQTIVKKFDDLTKTIQKVENKSLDNVVSILAQLYNFKLFDAKLIYEILHRLTENFDEKNVECILHILRSVGFGLRKDDPLALKNLILELQKQAASASEGKVSNSRVKFLLDILLAIKNNNVTKIPNYDTSYSEHLKKIIKGFIRKGNYITQLNISLDDLLKADERGRWWVVGSAWTGNIENNDKKETLKKSYGFSQKLLNLARKQRMNTDTRRDIFCILMSAEDYLDAFEKLLKLGLKNQQEREIINVILHCCLQEKVYNPYYAVLAQKFCEYDRKFQMTIKCSVWDKLKTLGHHSGGQISNLAKLLTHLFIEKGLPISTLKIVEFSELDKVTLRFMRQILLGILLYPDMEALQGVFEKVVQSDKLKMFRESLRLFIHHFLLRNLKSETVPDDQKQNLEARAKIIEKILVAKDTRTRHV